MFKMYFYLRSVYSLFFGVEEYDWFQKHEMEKKFFHRETIDFESSQSEF